MRGHPHSLAGVSSCSPPTSGRGPSAFVLVSVSESTLFLDMCADRGLAGEHTSYTHAWIFSALDSAVRGTTQLLLDMGLVDEAKQIVDTWMGRWISI